MGWALHDDLAAIDAWTSRSSFIIRWKAGRSCLLVLSLSKKFLNETFFKSDRFQRSFEVKAVLAEVGKEVMEGVKSIAFVANKMRDVSQNDFFERNCRVFKQRCFRFSLFFNCGLRSSSLWKCFSLHRFQNLVLFDQQTLALFSLVF